MGNKATKSKNRSRSIRIIRYVGRIFLGFACLLLVLAIGLVVAGWIAQIKTNHRQNALQPFYNTAGLNKNGPMGQIMRSQPLDVKLTHGTAERILYRSQNGKGDITFSSGMVFIPNNSASGAPRPVVAWAHGTVGMGDACAPSRTPNPISNIGFVDEMLARGWVVTATDYAGLGTPGIEGYLVGADEARDVLNSVRAARTIPAAQAGSTYAVWGHSQGGHSALFTAALAASYAPELKLVGTAAVAPAAELPALFSETRGALDWVIGPEVMMSWPQAYSNLDVRDVTTDVGYRSYQKIANQCIAQAALGGLIRNKLSQQFFDTNPIDAPGWRTAAIDQTAPVPNSSQPVLVAETLQDTVVLPDTTALYVQRACQAGANMTSMWLDGLNHVQVETAIAPEVIGWLGDRFDGRPTAPTCNRPLPITPAKPPQGTS